MHIPFKSTYQVIYCQVRLVNIVDISATKNTFNTGGWASLLQGKQGVVSLIFIKQVKR